MSIRRRKSYKHPNSKPFNGHSSPTLYNGVQYRSKMEAKFAAILTMHKIPFEYEPRTFWLDGFGYVPDFYLPQSRTWVEIKGRVTNDALVKMHELGRHLNAEWYRWDPLYRDDLPDPWDDFDDEAEEKLNAADRKMQHVVAEHPWQTVVMVDHVGNEGEEINGYIGPVRCGPHDCFGGPFSEFIVDGERLDIEADAEQTWLVKCVKCDAAFFYYMMGSWSCPACGEHKNSNQVVIPALSIRWQRCGLKTP